MGVFSSLLRKLLRIPLQTFLSPSQIPQFWKYSSCSDLSYPCAAFSYVSLPFTTSFSFPFHMTVQILGLSSSLLAVWSKWLEGNFSTIILFSCIICIICYFMYCFPHKNIHGPLLMDKSFTYIQKDNNSFLSALLK